MPAPNIVNVATIRCRTSVQNVTTVASNVVVNDVNSSNVIKLNNIFFHNQGNTTCDATVQFIRGSNVVLLANAMTVPTKTTLTMLGKEMSTYMEEGDYLRVQASANNLLTVFVSYDQLS